MVELLEATKKVVENFNHDSNVREINLLEGSIEENLVFGSSPPVVAAAAKYEVNVTGEHPEKILLPQNLIDPEQRAASRASLIRMRNYLASYKLSLPANSKNFFGICGNDRAAVAAALSLRFYHSQIDLEDQRFDEIEALLDMMDGTWEATVDGDTIVFPTVRQQEDFQRSLSRIQRLEELRTTRDRLLQQRAEKMQDSNRIKAPPGIWDSLRHSGISVWLDSDRLTINGKWIILPVEKSTLIPALGQPREIEGDPGRLVWDHWGITAIYAPGTTQIESFIIALRPRPTHWWPRKMIGGRLTVLGVPVDENSTPWSLNRKLDREKFVGDDSGWEWKLALERYTIKTQFNWNGTIDSLTIDAVPTHP